MDLSRIVIVFSMFQAIHCVRPRTALIFSEFERCQNQGTFGFIDISRHEESRVFLPGRTRLRLQVNVTRTIRDSLPFSVSLSPFGNIFEGDLCALLTDNDRFGCPRGWRRSLPCHCPIPIGIYNLEDLNILLRNSFQPFPGHFSLRLDFKDMACVSFKLEVKLQRGLKKRRKRLQGRSHPKMND